MHLSKYIATLGPIGYLFAPGTMGTLAVLPFIYYLSLLSPQNQLVAIAFVSIVSFFVIHHALRSFNVDDPSEIILDEVVGCLITFIGISFSAQAMVAGFLLFRLFDIVKPFGIKYLEKLSGAWGVLLDDCVAGLFANIILYVWFY